MQACNYNLEILTPLGLKKRYRTQVLINLNAFAKIIKEKRFEVIKHKSLSNYIKVQDSKITILIMFYQRRISKGLRRNR
jgi:ribosomal protein S18